MNEREKIIERIKSRKSKKVLTDSIFKKIYNTMIKGMVLLFVVILVALTFQVTTFDDIDKYFTQELSFLKEMKWFNQKNDDQAVSWMNIYDYHDGSFMSKNEQIIAMKAGRVTNVAQKDDGYEVKVLSEDDYTITYQKIDHIDIDVLDYLELHQKIGTSKGSVEIHFDYLGKEVSYEEYLGME